MSATPLPSWRAPQGDARLLAGFWLGVLGVTCFAVTLPATRLATGTAADPQLSPAFVTAGRAALAGLLSAVFLLATRSPRPTGGQWRALALSMAGNAMGFPLLLAWALRSVTATHAAVIIALLPLVTAAVAAWVLHQRARPAFWACAVAGSALVVVFAWLRAGAHGGFGFDPADGLLAGAVVAASVGYVYGAKVTPALGAERVICWCAWARCPSRCRWRCGCGRLTRATFAPAAGRALSMWARCRCGPASSPGTVGWTGAARCA